LAIPHGQQALTPSRSQTGRSAKAGT